MKKLILSIVTALALSGCAALQTLQLASTTTVSPTQAILAANAFDGIEAGATGFLTFCHAGGNADATCSATNRRNVIKYVRAGRAGRNQMETYIQTSASSPSVVYNTVVAAVTSLQASPAASFVGAK